MRLAGMAEGTERPHQNLSTTPLSGCAYHAPGQEYRRLLIAEACRTAGQHRPCWRLKSMALSLPAL